MFEIRLYVHLKKLSFLNNCEKKNKINYEWNIWSSHEWKIKIFNNLKLSLDSIISNKTKSYKMKLLN